MTNYSWINFIINLEKLPWHVWIKLGECAAKCEQIKSIPLKPNIKEKLHLIYLAKGAHATTAIEGNTLSEEQVKDLLEKKLKLPPSKQYLEQEVKNIIEACNKIADDVLKGALKKITVEQICRYNNYVLSNDIPRDEAAVPGVIRTHNVVVGNVYRAPRAQDASILLEKFCDWMNGGDFTNEQLPLHFAIIKSIAAHLYIAWIHPFGDGNGRVARLLEFMILLNSGVPSPAAHLLSNHYNITRAEYYRQLDKASRIGDPTEFFTYAIEGFLDGLQEQLQYIQGHIVSVCWRDYIYEVFSTQHSNNTIKRRRELAIRISEQSEPVDKNSILLLMRKEYRDKTERTLSRDLNELEKMGLVIRKNTMYAAKKGSILQFLPFSTS